MIAWGITYLVHSSLLIAAVWIASRFVRSTSARETFWKIALIAPLLTASVQTNVPLPHATPARITLPAATALSTAPAAFQPTETIDETRRTEIAPLHRSPDPRTLIIGVWLAGAALMLLRLFAGRAWFARALRDRVELLREHDRLARLRAAMACRPLVRLTESSAVGSPIAMSQFTSGWEIVVPRVTFARLSDEQKETILAHEIAHLLRRDLLWLLGGELIKALLFLQPLNWIAQKKMKECAEFLCDDLAVRHTSNPRALAETLAELATAFTPMPRAVAAMAEGGSNLMARVARVLSMHGDRERPLRLASRIAIGAGAVVALAAFGPGMSPMMESKKDSAGAMHLSDGVLSRTFDGPEGATKVQLTARDTDLAEDGSWFRFTSRSGFLHVHHTALNGPARDIDATPGRDLEPVTHYRVGGVEQPWNEDGRRVLLSAFRAEGAYDSAMKHEKAAPRDAIRVTPVQRRPDPGRALKTWDANVELTGTRDHVPTYLNIRAAHVRYDQSTGEVFFDDASSLYVEETIGGDKRTFTRDANDLVWSGTFGQTEVSGWLETILRKQTTLPRDVIESLGRR
jgi:beta-lactamase regulating signal transducer with metallopeptidase domain